MKKRMMARPKGKKFFPVGITLTQGQIDYLNAQPNASEVVRKILDDLIQVRKDIDANLGAVLLKKQLEALQEEEHRLSGERDHQVQNNENLWKFTIEEYDTYPYTGDRINEKKVEKRRCIDWEDEEKQIPKPTDEESYVQDAQIALKVLKDYDKALASVRQKIQDIRKQIIGGE